MFPEKDTPTPYEKQLRAAMNAMMKVYQDPDGEAAIQISTLERHRRFVDGLISAKQQETSHDRPDTDD